MRISYILSYKKKFFSTLLAPPIVVYATIVFPSSSNVKKTFL